MEQKAALLGGAFPSVVPEIGETSWGVLGRQGVLQHKEHKLDSMFQYRTIHARAGIYIDLIAITKYSYSTST
jgi:hypothetical protein